MKQLRKELGSFTVEATLSVTLFICAFVVLISFANQACLEAITQYAVNQTAKEISQYLYVLNRVGIDTDLPSSTEGEQKINSLLTDLYSFNSVINDGYNTVKSEVDSGIDIQQMGTDMDRIIRNAGKSYQDIRTAAEQLDGSFGAVMADPISIIRSLATVALDTAVRDVASRVVAPPVCKALVTKYIGSSPERAHAYLLGMGVKDGLDGLDFSLSSILKDGSSVIVSVVYRVDSILPNFREDKLLIHQTASTRGWVKNKKE